MIYRDINGSIIIIKRDNYANEMDFNEAVYKLKQQFLEKYKTAVYIEPVARSNSLTLHARTKDYRK